MDKRPLAELKIRARPALKNPNLVLIAGQAKSPNVSYELALAETDDPKQARACRWLACIKRDYGQAELNKFVKENNQKAKP